MSQVTRCPACGTSFRVVPDQLRISQGWVRCGQCNEIFDAAQSLRDQAALAGDATVEAAPQDDAARVPSPTPATVPLPDASPEPAEPDASPAPVLVDIAPQWLQSAPPEIPVSDPVASLEVDFAEYQQSQVAQEEAVPADEAPAEPVVAGAELSAPAPDLKPLVPLGPERLFVALTPDAITRPEASVPMDAMPLPQRPASELPVSSSQPVRAAPLASPAPAVPVRDPAHAEVSFLREAADAAPMRPVAAPRRAWWACIAVLLMLALALQWAVQARDRLAAKAPALKPVLQALCLPFQCRVQPLRRIDAIVIDGSALSAQGEQGYRLSLTLRNRAEHAVALPALVLSLTDIQEQAVVRRVLLPDALGTPPAELAAHGEWSTSVDLQMVDNAGRARVVGYRLDAFYP